MYTSNKEDVEIIDQEFKEVLKTSVFNPNIGPNDELIWVDRAQFLQFICCYIFVFRINVYNLIDIFTNYIVAKQQEISDAVYASKKNT